MLKEARGFTYRATRSAFFPFMDFFLSSSHNFSSATVRLAGSLPASKMLCADIILNNAQPPGPEILFIRSKVMNKCHYLVGVATSKQLAESQYTVYSTGLCLMADDGIWKRGGGSYSHSGRRGGRGGRSRGRGRPPRRGGAHPLSRFQDDDGDSYMDGEQDTSRGQSR